MKTIPAEKGGSSNPTIPEIIRFLNLYKNQIVCGEEKTNYMHYAFEKRGHRNLFTELFNSLLYHDDYMVDVNAISYSKVTGQPQTVIDFLNDILADTQRSQDQKDEIKELRTMFIEEMGAKTYSQLPEVESKRS